MAADGAESNACANVTLGVIEKGVLAEEATRRPQKQTWLRTVAESRG
jgi:hypothetical protein